MNGRAFLRVARDIIRGATDAHWRAAAGRAYYALFLEGRDALAGWGFRPGPGENVHPFARLRFVYAADQEVKDIGRARDRLVRLRSKADYDLTALPELTSDAAARQAIRDATDAIARLDVILADAARVAAIIADIRARWP